MTTPNPLVQRRRLRTELRRARADANLKQGEVAAAMDWSVSKIIRIETGAVGVSTNDLRALLSLYGIPDRITELVDLAKAARERSWLSSYREAIPSQYLQYIEYEEAASVLRIYEPLLLPGLLQTKEYATAVIQRLADQGTSQELMDTRIEIRMRRQRLLEQQNPPTVHFIVDEAAIDRLAGEPDTAQDQIARLIEVANRPDITIEVIPFTAGLHRGLLESFIVLEFADTEDSDVLYLETSKDMIVSHDEAGDISGYREVFEELSSISLGHDGTLAYLANLARRMKQQEEARLRNLLKGGDNRC